MNLITVTLPPSSEVAGDQLTLPVAEARTLMSRLGVRVIRAEGNRGGRKAVLRPCPHCGEQFGGAAMRLHRPRCPSKPA